ncbi:MAG: maltotransferase domain-containing protein, partial [Candidatus Omnitrophota bacterium]
MAVKKKTDTSYTRVMIEKVSPEIDGGAFPVKRVEGEQVVVRANIFTDGHDAIA